MSGNSALNCVYFLAAYTESKPLIKIGRSANLPGRLKSLDTANPGGTALLAAISGNDRLEGFMHEAFGQYRFRNEWFRPSSRLITVIDGLQSTEFREILNMLAALPQDVRRELCLMARRWLNPLRYKPPLSGTELLAWLASLYDDAARAANAALFATIHRIDPWWMTVGTRDPAGELFVFNRPTIRQVAKDTGLVWVFDRDRSFYADPRAMDDPKEVFRHYLP